MKTFIQSIKEDHRKKQQRKKEEKSYLQELKKEDEALAKELGEKKDFLGIKYFIDTMRMDDQEEKELMEVLTDSEKQTLQELKDEEKILKVIVMGVFGIAIVVILTASLILNNIGKTDLESITIPIMEEYYYDKYQTKITIKDIEYLKYQDEENKEQTSNIQIASIDNDKHIVAINNKTIGDDIDTKDVYEEYNTYIKEINPNMQLIANNPLISYQDYYKTYNVFTPHIKALPDKMNLNNLKKNNKLTISDVIMYQGSINIDELNNFIKALSPHSQIYLIKNENGIPSKITILKQNNNIEITIQDTRQLTKDITYYNLDSTKNRVRGLEIQKVKANVRDTNPQTYKIDNAYLITFETDYKISDQLPTYYLVSINKDLLNTTNIVQFDIRTHQEIYLKDYSNIYFVEAGGNIYIIGNTEIGFGNKKEIEESFWCSLGLC